MHSKYLSLDKNLKQIVIKLTPFVVKYLVYCIRYIKDVHESTPNFVNFY